MTPYLTNTQIREFEDKFGWKKIEQSNKFIGEFLDFKPKVSYAVGDDEGYCYNPDGHWFPDEYSQKKEAQRWLDEQITKYPHGYVAKDGYKVIKIESFPDFHQDWNHLMEALKRFKNKGFSYMAYHDDIFKTWKLLYGNIKTMNEIKEKK